MNGLKKILLGILPVLCIGVISEASSNQCTPRVSFGIGGTVNFGKNGYKTKVKIAELLKRNVTTGYDVLSRAKISNDHKTTNSGKLAITVKGPTSASVTAGTDNDAGKKGYKSLANVEKLNIDGETTTFNSDTLTQNVVNGTTSQLDDDNGQLVITSTTTSTIDSSSKNTAYNKANGTKRFGALQILDANNYVNTRVNTINVIDSLLVKYGYNGLYQKVKTFIDTYPRLKDVANDTVISWSLVAGQADDLTYKKYNLCDANHVIGDTSLFDNASHLLKDANGNIAEFLMDNELSDLFPSIKYKPQIANINAADQSTYIDIPDYREYQNLNIGIDGYGTDKYTAPQTTSTNKIYLTPDGTYSYYEYTTTDDANLKDFGHDGMQTDIGAYAFVDFGLSSSSYFELKVGADFPVGNKKITLNPNNSTDSKSKKSSNTSSSTSSTKGIELERKTSFNILGGIYYKFNKYFDLGFSVGCQRLAFNAKETLYSDGFNNSFKGNGWSALASIDAKISFTQNLAMTVGIQYVGTPKSLNLSETKGSKNSYNSCYDILKDPTIQFKVGFQFKTN